MWSRVPQLRRRVAPGLTANVDPTGIDPIASIREDVGLAGLSPASPSESSAAGVNRASDMSAMRAGKERADRHTRSHARLIGIRLGLRPRAHIGRFASTAQTIA